MDKSLPQLALVTGASRGIGKAIAETLASPELTVYITYVSKSEEAEAVVKKIQDAGSNAKAFKLDANDGKAISEFFATEIKNKFILKTLVNNAGITKDGFIIRMNDADFDAVMNVNLRGAFICLREAAKIMSKQRHGKIINITSVVGQMGNAGQANYSSAKAALIGLTKSAAKELASRNITVNAVAPGFIETDMTAEFSEQMRAYYMEHIPLKRLGTTQDIADTVAFLASEKASYITGQVIAVNGGIYC